MLFVVLCCLYGLVGSTSNGTRSYLNTGLFVDNLFSTSDSITQSIDSSSRVDFNYGGDSGLSVFDMVTVCARCYAKNFSTEENTFIPLDLVNKDTFAYYQFVNNSNSNAVVPTLVFAIHHAEQKYDPREMMDDVEVEIRAPAGKTIDLILSNNLEPFSNSYNIKIKQRWYIKVYNNIRLRQIISHSLITKHEVDLVYKYSFTGNAPTIVHMCNSTDCDQPSVTATAFDYPTGGKTLINHLINEGYIKNFTMYIGCATAKSMQVRDLSDGLCYAELKYIAVLFIALTYGVVGGCICCGMSSALMFVLSVCVLCKKDFKRPQFD